MTAIEERLMEMLEIQAKQIDELLRINEQQAQKIEELLQKIDELTGGRKDSHNSSMPPSSDGYRKPPSPKSLRKPSGKKPGGQKGHKGSGMKIALEPDEIVTHHPEACQGCAYRGMCKERVKEKRYVVDVEIQRRVTLHEQMECSCSVLKNKTICGRFPEDVTATKQYGVNVASFAMALSTVGMVSIERIRQLMCSICGLKISTGTLQEMLHRLKAKTAGAVEYIRNKVRELPVLHCDETGLRTAGRLYWLHSYSNADWCYYHLHRSRSYEGMDAADILPKYEGIAVHDCWAPYFKYDRAKHALCNAHVLRELIYAEENLKQEWAAEMQKLLLEMRKAKLILREAGGSSFPEGQLEHYSQEYDRIIRLGMEKNPIPDQSGHFGRPKKGQVRALLERLEKYKQELLRFAHDWQVPFTNNEAERALRPSKVKQKVSGCFRIQGGGEEYAGIMSYLATMRKQGVSCFEAIQAAFQGNAMLLLG